MTGQSDWSKMMKTIQASEAKAKFLSLLTEAENGETIAITRRGKTVARIVPPVDDERDRRRQAVEQLREWRKSLPKARMTVEDILSARDEGRKP